MRGMRGAPSEDVDIETILRNCAKIADAAKGIMGALPLRIEVSREKFDQLRRARGSCVMRPALSRNGGLRIGMGRYVRNAHEVCVVASKGRGTALVRDHGTPSVITERPSGLWLD